MRFLVEPLYTYIEGANMYEKYIVRDCLRFFDENARDSEDYKNNRWDGFVELYDVEEDRFMSGLVNTVTRNLKKKNIEVEIVYLPKYSVDPSKIKIDESLFHHPELRDYQKNAIYKSLYYGRGIHFVGTGGGKTDIAIGMIKHFQALTGYKRFLFTVNTTTLLKQTHMRFLDAGLEDVGLFNADEKNTESSVIIGTVQSIYSATKTNRDLVYALSKVDGVIFDEIHHMPSNSWLAVASSIKSQVRFGLSASPFEDISKEHTLEDYVLLGMTGDVLTRVPANFLCKKGYLATPIVTMVDTKKAKRVKYKSWNQTYMDGIVKCDHRNAIITHIAKQFYKDKWKGLVLVNRIEHGKEICKMFHDNNMDTFFFHGDGLITTYSPSDEQADEHGFITKGGFDYEKIYKVYSESERVIAVGSPILDEGVDLPSINIIFNASGGKSPKKTIQKTGRGLRRKDEDNYCLVFDFFDTHNKVLKSHSDARHKTYSDLGFRVNFDLNRASKQCGFNIDSNYPVIEEDALYRF